MNSFDDDDDGDNRDIAGFDHLGDEDDDSLESQVWQLLRLINPGDEDSALQQFDAWREAFAATGDDAEPLPLLVRVIDWRAGFHVDADDPRTLVQVLNELAARWNLAIDWNGDPDEEEFFADTDTGTLLALAFDRLAESGYTVWAWDTGDDAVSGVMTLRSDSEALRELATAMHIHVQPGSDFG